ncbi:MAG: hypothetical protein ABF461_08310 [Zymomonas mobilis subsp. pomaceae]|uniref:hypothetical protein n=1 Tax=Zymomonas mobilis TaxID=542 RepID=UPI0005A1F12F|nr:hypothetical protein [Zymomonas mobilis]MDX5949268.1 hypothetical protein [Zymomonas mobilis subsp. pomaceae]GEB89727.1 hypothetical protein ZMO02_13640 [Zymomonas mobilis subsp. pomaceae]
MQAARAEYNHRMRGDQKLQIYVATGLPSLSVCQPVKNQGFKSIIDQQNWQITDVTHTLNNSGLITNFNLEINP